MAAGGVDQVDGGRWSGAEMLGGGRRSRWEPVERCGIRRWPEEREPAAVEGAVACGGTPGAGGYVRGVGEEIVRIHR
jgi:hypothetical protein